MRKVWLVLLGLMTGLVSCDTGPDPVNCDFDEEAMLTNYADKVIIPRFSDLSLSLLLLQGSAQQFVGSPSIGLLNEVRVYYRAAYGQYQECGTFAFGPGLVNGIPFRERFNTFPTNTGAIELNIQNGAPVSSSAKSTVGFPALDYLLFSAPGTSNSDVLALFTTDQNAANRRDYLSQLTSELATTAQSIESGWLETGGNYRQQFIENVGTSEGTSIGLLLNEFNFDFEILKNFKFKIPLGKLNGGIVIPEGVEAYYSGGSVELALRQAEAFKKFFEGVGMDGANGTGIYEYVVCLDTKGSSGQLLGDEILSQFDNVIDAVDAIPNPMSETLVTDKPVVDNAYQQMQMMVPKIKYEMTAALGVQINYQDNDGD